MPEDPGKKEDLNFLQNDTSWLKRSIVSHEIQERNGRFWVVMIFTDEQDPLKKLIRPISDHPSLAVAERHADILQRQISADPRDPRPKKSNDDNNIRRN